MSYADAVGVFAGAVALGLVHGVEPGHGWPVAASYAMDRANKWLYGLAASLIIGVGHLVSSVAVVGAFHLLKRYVSPAGLQESLTVVGVQIGSPLGVVAGLLLVALGAREYLHGHSHDEDHEHHAHSHDHDVDHGHARDASVAPDADGGSLRATLTATLPFVGGDGHGHDHAHPSGDEAADRGLWGLAGFAFLLGFVHQEEFEIIALCTGSAYCLELMVAYALAVIVGMVGLTLLLVAGYTRYEDRAERYADYLPAFSAAVLIVMGVGFALGLL